MEQSMGKRIMENRKRLGLTQDQLAEKLGVTAQAVSKWENDQSCPDIATLPQLADIFSISVDALLGREAPAVEAQVVEENNTQSGIHMKGNKLEFRWDSGRKAALGFAVYVILVGLLYLAAVLLEQDISFWNILWPTALVTTGIFGMGKRYSFFHTLCILLGLGFLADRFFHIPWQLDQGVIWAGIILLVGISLLVEALRKAKKPIFQFHVSDDGNQFRDQKKKNEFESDSDSFSYTGCFGEATQHVPPLCQLRRGEASVSFGEYTVDLSDVQSVAQDCQVELTASFGQLNLLVPSRFLVKLASSTAFGAVEMEGHADEDPEGVIHVDASCSFGQITVSYI